MCGDSKSQDYDKDQNGTSYVSKLIHNDTSSTVLWQLEKMWYPVSDDLLAEVANNPYVAPELKWKTSGKYLTTRDWKSVQCRF